MSHLDLINSIVSNPQAHQVNRKQKMSDSIDVAESNIRKSRQLKADSDLIRDTGNRGYGEGRKMGD
jgi:hypothetical protein